MNITKNKCVIILGMHRSATSLVAKGLSLAGCEMGGNNSPGIDNPEGFYENWDFVDLNEKILNEARGSWDNPPSHEAILKAGEKFKDEIKRLISKYKKNGLWGWKDPRTTLTIECYLSFIDDDIIFITNWRDPHMVARSLSEPPRENMSYDSALMLVKEYNKRLLKFLRIWSSQL